MVTERYSRFKLWRVDVLKFKTLKLNQKGGMTNYIVLFAITMLLLAMQVNGVIAQ